MRARASSRARTGSVARSASSAAAAIGFQSPLLPFPLVLPRPTCVTRPFSALLRMAPFYPLTLPHLPSPTLSRASSAGGATFPRLSSRKDAVGDRMREMIRGANDKDKAQRSV